MRRLTDLGAYNLAHRRGRSVLTALGVVLGVAILFGVLVTGASIDGGVNAYIRSFTGRADVLATPLGDYNSSLPVGGITDLRRLPDVEAATASFTQYLTARSTVGRDNYLLTGLSVTGVDSEASAVTDFHLAHGYLPVSGSAVIALAQKAASELHVGVGGTVLVTAPAGNLAVRVVGVLAGSGAAKANNGDVGYVGLAFAQSIARLPGAVDQVAIVLAPGTSTNAWLAAHRYAVTGVDLQSVSESEGTFRSFLSVIEATLAIFAALSMFVAGFLIYLTLTTAVMERTRQYGTLRALGASRGQVRRVVLSEALFLGVVSTAAGLGLGLLIATVLIRLLGHLVGIASPSVVVTGADVATASAVGLVVTVIAALVPARRAARLSPVTAMKGDFAADRRLSPAWALGALFLVVGVALISITNSVTVVGAGSILIVLGAVLLVPPLLPPLAGFVGRLTRRSSPGVGAMAVTHLVKERSRSAYTLGLVMVILTQVVVIGAVSASLNHSLNEVLNRQYGADIEVSGGNGPITPAIEDTVLTTPGVGATTGLRFGETLIERGRGQPSVGLMFIDPSSYFAVEGFSWSDGNDTTAGSALAAGGSVLLPKTVAIAQHVTRDGTVTLQTLKGPHRFNVAGIYQGFSTNPSVVVGDRDGAALFGTNLPDVIAIDVAGGARPAVVEQTIAQRLGIPAGGSNALNTKGLGVFSSGDIKASARSQLNGFLVIFYAVLGITALVGLLGMANTLAMSVVQRYREIGVLRAIGTHRRQVAAMVVTEAATLALVALVIAIPLGFILSVALVGATTRSLGFVVAYEAPWSALPVVVVIAAAVALLAAAAPARRASRLQMVEALRFD